MRSETNADSEADRNEPIITDGEPEVHVSDVPTVAQIEALGEALFGKSEPVAEDAPLQWTMIKADNYMVRTLKRSVIGLAHAVESEIKRTEKDIKRAQRVFYG